MEILVGVLVSIVVQIIKKYFKTGSWQSWGIALVLSVAGAAIYTMVVDTPIWPVILSTLTTAGAFYSIIISRLESMTDKV